LTQDESPRGAAVSSEVESLRRQVERLAILAGRERGLLNAILEHSPHGIIVANAKGELILHNPAAERIWAGSATAGSVMAWGQYRGFHPDGRPYAPEDWLMARSLTHGETITARETHIVRFDGTPGVVLGSSAPLYDDKGKISGAVSVFADVSELKSVAIALRAAFLEKERANRSLTTTLNSIGDGVIATDAAGVIAFVNPVAEALTGWSAADATGLPLGAVFRVLNERTRRPAEGPVERVLREGSVVGLANHTVLVRRDGAEIPIDDSGAPILDEDGALTGVVLVFRDVTAKRRDQERREFLAEASNVLASSLDVEKTLATLARLAVPRLADWCAIDVMDHDRGRLEQLAVAHVDPAKVSLADDVGRRYPPDPDAATGAPHVVRTGVSELYPEIPKELLEAGARDAEHLRVIRELDLRSAMVVPLRARGNTMGAITFIFAESGRRYTPADLEFAEELARRAAIALDNARLFESEQKARRTADVSNRAKDDFLATVSHELRTPLNAMLGWTRLLRAGDLTPERRERALETIERNAVTQAQLIEDLLDVSRIISGKLRLDVQSVEMNHIVEQATDSLRLASEGREIHVLASLDPNAGPVMGDPHRLQQVVWNLLSNAIKFTPKGGRIHITLERIDSSLQLCVIDNGQGMRPEFVPHVFERFRQEDGAITRAHGGLGLGLSICRHIVELHGGTITASSRGEGMGSKFTVRVPVSSVRREVRSTSSRLTPVSPSLDFECPPQLEGLKVLIVDDEVDARELLEAVLDKCGAIVLLAESVATALDVIARARPDILVSDIGMPGEDGYDLIRKVRALPAAEGGDIPAAALTAYARAEDRRKALNAGFMMHVPKPVEPAELVAVIANLARFAVKPR
jgi:PAS domain S-box-containing protein